MLERVDHICFVIPSLEAGGAERVVSLLANYYSSKKIKVSMVFLKNDIFYTLNEEIQIFYPKFIIKRDAITLLKILSFYRITIKSIKPDVVISFLEFYNEIFLMSMIGLNNNIYVCDRSSPFLKKGFVLATIRNILYPMAKGVVIQTLCAQKIIKEKKLNNNVLVLPNPVLKITNEWDPDPKGNKIISYVGRLTKQKNLKFLIKIFSELQNDEWILHIVGDGSVRSELEEYVIELQLQKKVIFLGTQKNIQYFLSKSMIFAFPSLLEGFPNALLEAMALGVPSISNNCDTGPSDLIVDGKNGFLVSVGDYEGFKMKLLMLMKNKELREEFSQRSKSMRYTYSIENIGEKLLYFIAEK